jgi:hypothetical protein
MRLYASSVSELYAKLSQNDFDQELLGVPKGMVSTLSFDPVSGCGNFSSIKATVVKKSLIDKRKK